MKTYNCKECESDCILISPDETEEPTRCPFSKYRVPTFKAMR